MSTACAVVPAPLGRDQLIESHLHLVDSLVNCLLRRRRGVLKSAGLERDDLIQEGRIGLVKAVDSFDCARGTSFVTHATNSIRYAIADALRAVGIKCDVDEDTTSDAGGEVLEYLPDAENFTQRSDLKLAVEAALSTLDPKVRQAVELHYFENQTQAQIAARLEVSQATASRLIAAGLAALKPHLTDTEG